MPSTALDSYANLLLGGLPPVSLLPSLRGRPIEGVVAICLDDPVLFAFAFLHVLQCGGTPLAMPTVQEMARLKIPLSIDANGLQEWEVDECELKAERGTYYAFSSGSTGHRRPLRFAQERAEANAAAHTAAIGLDGGETIFQCLPIYHSFGIVAYIFGPLVSGCRVRLGLFFDALFGRGEDLALQRSVAHLTPYHLQLLRRRHVRELTKIRRLTIGAGPLRRSEAEYAQEICHDLFATYGLSEAGPRVSSGRVEISGFQDGWIGFALPGVETRLDEAGGLWIRSPYVSLDFSQEEFFSSGDCVDRLADGSLVFRHRVHDVLRIRGKTVPRILYSRNLEAVLGLPCEVAQLDYCDDLVVFVEGPELSMEQARQMQRKFPELKEAIFRSFPGLARTPLGKVDLPAMLRLVQS